MGSVSPFASAHAPLAGQVGAINLATDVQRLNVLDDAWTVYLEAEPKSDALERDLPVLGGLVDEMCRLILSVARGCRDLRGVIGELEVDWDEELRQVLERSEFGGPLLDRLPEAPFAAQVVEACTIVEAEAEAEVEALQSKLRQLSESGFSPGDIGGRLKCAILLAGSGASLVGLVLTPFAVVPGTVVGGVGILVSTLAAANGWNCRRAGDVAAAAA